MMNATTINKQYLALVNAEVEKVAAAREVYPDDYVDRVILPQHEQAVANLMQWRERQIAGFSAYGAGVTIGQRGRQQVVDPRIADIDAAMGAAIAAATNDYNTAIRAINTQLSQITKDGNVRIKAAQRVKDVATVNQVKSLIKQAQQAAAAQRQQASLVRGQAVAAARKTRQQAVAALTPTGQPIPPPIITVPSSPAPQPSLPATPVTMPDGGASVPQINVSVTTPSSGGGGMPDVFAPGGQDMTAVGSVAPAPMQAPSPTIVQSDSFGGLFDFSWLGDLFNTVFGPADYTNATQGTPQPSVPVAVPAQGPADNPQADQYDVFTTDPWTGGAFSAGPIMENSMIALANRLPVIPARAIGFGQWATLVNSVVQAGSQIGAAAISAKLGQPKAPQQVIVPQQSSGTNTALIIGGVAAVGLLAVVLATRKK